MNLNVTEVRRRMLPLIDNLPDEGIVITRHGEPMARLLPVKPARKGRYVTSPMVPAKGPTGTIRPTTEASDDLLFG